MNNLIYNAPFNSLSFGNVSYCILKEIFKREIDTAIFPIGGTIDFKAYTKKTKQFDEKFNQGFSKRLEKLNKNNKTLKLWHIHDSEQRLSFDQTLLTFHETSFITETEKTHLSLQERIIVTSNYTKKVFESAGVKNVYFAPLGFDDEFYPTGKKYHGDGIIHFGLMGKFEKRKNTEKIIKAWIRKFGNNPRYKLTCCIINPFIKSEVMNQILVSQVFEGKKPPFNVNILPYLDTNEQVNDFLNSIDIDLSGLSSAEGWGLPSFNATCLGKWSCVSNVTAHKDWADEKNSILVEPDGVEEIYDNVFFKKGLPYNQGNGYLISEDSIISALEKSLTFAKTKNTNGIELGNRLTYKNTVDTICHIMSQPTV